MNCISTPQSILLLCLFIGGCGAPASEPEAGSERYGLNYLVTPSPADGSVQVRLTVSQGDDLLREMRFDADPERFRDFHADGQLSISDGRVTWTPPQNGGTLSWQVDVPRKRNGNAYDAWLASDWGLFRAEDIIPRAATRTLIGAASVTVLQFKLPRKWTAVTEYHDDDGKFAVSKATRRFAQPSGWIVIGELGVRREQIAGTRVAVAAPENQDVRRMDMLALLNWTLPELAKLVPTMPKRLTIVSAGEPMWRGALSAPQSIYVHAERPLISENGTSTLLHEAVHVAMSASAVGEYDWIVEGLAEYYSLQLLKRSGSITARRYERAIAQQARWAASATTLCSQASTGASTALAVGVFAALDQEIRENSKNKRSLDDVIHQLLESNAPLDLRMLELAATEVNGQKPDALHIDRLPGCRKMDAS